MAQKPPKGLFTIFSLAEPCDGQRSTEMLRDLLSHETGPCVLPVGGQWVQSEKGNQDTPDSLTISDDDRPSYTYAKLIEMAILEAPDRPPTLAQIYKWISNTFPFYRKTQLDWRNRVRHNLSTNKAFQKIERSRIDSGRGGFWTIQGTIEKRPRSIARRPRASQSRRNASRNATLVGLTVPKACNLKPSLKVESSGSSELASGRGWSSAAHVPQRCAHDLRVARHERAEDEIASMRPSSFRAMPKMCASTAVSPYFSPDDCLRRHRDNVQALVGTSGDYGLIACRDFQPEPVTSLLAMASEPSMQPESHWCD